MKNEASPPKTEKGFETETEVYILKIYRRQGGRGKSLVGTIEEIRGLKKGAFQTAQGLLDLLEGRWGKGTIEGR